MEQVDFGFAGEDGFTIYRMCFEKYIRNRFTLKWAKLVEKVVTETEAVFDFLVKQGINNANDVDAILEIPNANGETCFDLASRCSYKICDYIISRGIRVNTINTKMMVPEMGISTSTSGLEMMKLGINPQVIAYDGNSPLDLYPKEFKSEEAKRLLATFPRSVHYSIEDIECEESCPAKCRSNFKRFYYKNGSLVEMTDQNRIGSGGFGMVFKGLFHGKPMAMKCMLIGKIEWRDYVKDAKFDLERNISEYRSQKVAAVGSGVIVPVACVRQQNQEKDANGKWIAKNYNIYIYPLYDCNLDELHGNYYDQFTEEIIAEIIHQCFIRTGSDQNIL